MYIRRPRLSTTSTTANPKLNAQQAAYNTAMSKTRVGVEWVFGDIANFFKFLNFKKKLKLGLSRIGKMYIVCAFLMNIHTCMYGPLTSSYFNIDPPILKNIWLSDQRNRIIIFCDFIY